MIFFPQESVNADILFSLIILQLISHELYNGLKKIKVNHATAFNAHVKKRVTKWSLITGIYLTIIYPLKEKNLPVAYHLLKLHYISAGFQISLRLSIKCLMNHNQLWTVFTGQR